MKRKFFLLATLIFIDFPYYSNAKEDNKLGSNIQKTRVIEDEIKANKEEPKILYIVPWKENTNNASLSIDFEPRSIRKSPKLTEENNLIDSSLLIFK